MVFNIQISINLRPELHQEIESTANSIGKSISDFIVDIVRINLDDAKAQKDLENFLKPRINAASQGKISKKTFNEIVDESFKKAQKVKNNLSVNVRCSLRH